MILAWLFFHVGVIFTFFSCPLFHFVAVVAFVVVAVAVVVVFLAAAVVFLVVLIVLSYVVCIIADITGVFSDVFEIIVAIPDAFVDVACVIVFAFVVLVEFVRGLLNANCFCYGCYCFLCCCLYYCCGCCCFNLPTLKVTVISLTDLLFSFANKFSL